MNDAAPQPTEDPRKAARLANLARAREKALANRATAKAAPKTSPAPRVARASDESANPSPPPKPGHPDHNPFAITLKATEANFVRDFARHRGVTPEHAIRLIVADARANHGASLSGIRVQGGTQPRES